MVRPQILLLSQALSYPLPLLSLTTHLALLSTRLPRLISEGEEIPSFDDDWEAAPFLYPREGELCGKDFPPLTLLVMAVGDNIIFDPNREELTVAEVVLAISITELGGPSAISAMDIDDGGKAATTMRNRNVDVVSIRTIDPPSRLTPPGVPDSLNTATGGAPQISAQEVATKTEGMHAEGVWVPPRGGIKRSLVRRILRMVVEDGGVGSELLQALESVEAG